MASPETTIDIPEPTLPHGWLSIAGLIAGFGDRSCRAPRSTLLVESQVHGVRVLEPDGSEKTVDAQSYRAIRDSADALVSAREGLVVGVRTADCVPILMVAPASSWAAAVHAGWRGTIGGIAAMAVGHARSFDIRASDLLVALGPSIGPCCYEVSDDLADRFEDADLAVVRSDRDAARRHLDLRQSNRRILEESGVRPEAIQDCGPCTRCASDRYHSFRADPGEGGRQISWIGWEVRRPPPGP